MKTAKRAAALTAALLVLGLVGCAHAPRHRAASFTSEPVYVGQDAAGRGVVASRVCWNETEQNDPPRPAGLWGKLVWIFGVTGAGLAVAWFIAPAAVIGILTWIFVRVRRQLARALQETVAGVEKGKAALADDQRKILKAALAEKQSQPTKEIVTRIRGGV